MIKLLFFSPFPQENLKEPENPGKRDFLKITSFMSILAKLPGHLLKI